MGIRSVGRGAWSGNALWRDAAWFCGLTGVIIIILSPALLFGQPLATLGITLIVAMLPLFKRGSSTRPGSWSAPALFLVIFWGVAIFTSEAAFQNPADQSIQALSPIKLAPVIILIALALALIVTQPRA